MIAWCLLTLLWTQYPNAAAGAFQSAYGGRAWLEQNHSFLLRGQWNRNGAKVPFELRISGRDSRFESGDFVSACREGKMHWLRAGHSPSVLRHALPGLLDADLLPFGLLSELSERFVSQGLVQGKKRFSGQGEQKRFLAQSAERHSIKLDFDPQSRLLLLARFSPRSAPPVEIAYSDYRKVGAFLVPHRIIRRVGGRIERDLFLDSIDLQARLEESDLQLERGLK